MKEYYLPGLQTNLRLNPSQTLRDDGFVNSIQEHIHVFLCVRGYPIDDDYIQYLFREKCLNEVWKNPHTKGGLCFTDDRFNDYLWIGLACVPSGNPLNDTLIRGHEESHALEKFDRLDILETLVRENSGKDVSFKGAHQGTIGMAGSLLALDIRGIKPPKNLELSLDFVNNIYKNNALEAYNLLY